MQRLATIGGLVCVLVCGGLIWGYTRLQDRCSRDEISDLVVSHLNRDKPGDGLVISNIHLGRQQLFSFPYTCEADVIALRGNVDLSVLPWTHIHFRVSSAGGEDRLSFGE